MDLKEPSEGAPATISGSHQEHHSPLASVKFLSWETLNSCSFYDLQARSTCPVSRRWASTAGQIECTYCDSFEYHLIAECTYIITDGNGEWYVYMYAIYIFTQSYIWFSVCIYIIYIMYVCIKEKFEVTQNIKNSPTIPLHTSSNLNHILFICHPNPSQWYEKIQTLNHFTDFCFTICIHF